MPVAIAVTFRPDMGACGIDTALRADSPASAITPRLCRYAPRCAVITPLGRPVVPEV